MPALSRLRHARQRRARTTSSIILAILISLCSVPHTALAEVAAVSTSPNVFAIPDPNAAIAFDGSAFGHGVGLCQWGARGRAMAGQSVQQIIGAYYRGTAIQKVLAPETTIRVLVHSGLSIAPDETERISAIGGGWQVVAQGVAPIGVPADGKLELTNPGGLRWQVKGRDGTVFGWGPLSGPIVVRPSTPETRIVLDFRPSGTVPGRRDTYFDTYRGEIILYPSSQGVDTVNRIGIEDYLRGVVPEESPASWPDAALQAQALAARSYAVFRAQTRAKQAWDVDDSTWDQVYRGWWAEHPNTNRAIDVTAGQLVMSGAQVAQTYFFASCNGWTDSNESVWGGTPLPYLRGIRDVDAAGQPFDRDAPGSIWTTGSLTVSQFEAMLKSDPETDVGSLRSVDLSTRAPSGRLMSVKVTGTSGTKAIAPETLQARFNRLRPPGVKPLLSTNFNVRWSTPEAVRDTQANATAVPARLTPRPIGGGTMAIPAARSGILALPGVNLLAPTGPAAPGGPVIAATPTPVPTPAPPPTRYDLTAPMPARPEGATNQYFPATGHNVGGAFLNYFLTFGGLDLFGMPRTEEMLEDGRTVQYFQRARLEFSVEKAGTPYEVQPSLLGDALTESRRPFPKSPVFDSTPSHQYFPETGHGLHNAFHRYWSENGGLDMFGYPTSEEMDENGVIVQYFQRARLEYRAEAPEGRRVVLGLIGDEYLNRRGWLPPPD
jgi:stage II sporulation protein D